jgi:HK97 family phage major capsid protein
MSDRLNALLKKRGEISDQMENLHTRITETEKREYTAEEKQAFEDFDADFKKVRRGHRVREARRGPQGRGRQAAAWPGEPRPPEATVKRRTYGRQMKAFKSETFGGAVEAEDAAYKSGMWCRAVIFGDQGAAQWCNEHDVPIHQELSYGALEQRSQNESVNSAGGYLVFPEMSTAIIDLREQYGTARRFMNVKPMASDTQTIPRRTGGLTGYFATEENAFTESSKTWGQVTLRAQALGCLTKVSRELDADAVISVADDIASEMAYGHGGQGRRDPLERRWHVVLRQHRRRAQQVRGRRRHIGRRDRRGVGP